MSLNDMMTLTVATGAAIVMAGRADAQAQAVCGSHDQIVAQLGQVYKEEQQSLGLAANGSVIEVFASDAGTWTILITDVNGRTCMAAAGEAWQTMASAEPGEGA
jgi:hypothetical protein